MEKEMELVIVADRADRLATEVLQLAKEKRRAVVICDVCEAAQLFSISIKAGQIIVEPDLPLFLRIPSQSVHQTYSDPSSQYRESLVALWAVAALSKSTVINRPNVNGLAGRFSNSAALTELRAGVAGGSIEIFSTNIPTLDEYSQKQWYIQDMVTGKITAWPAIPEGVGPYRARWAALDLAYEVVVVLGSQAWRCTTVSLDHLELERKSISLIYRLNLSFAVVIWSITYNLQSARLARITPFPSMNQVQFIWTELGPALLREFFP